MKKVLCAALFAASAMTGCWHPVQIHAPSDNVVYVLEQQGGYFNPEGRVIRCSGQNQCVVVYEGDSI